MKKQTKKFVKLKHSKQKSTGDNDATLYEVVTVVSADEDLTV